MGIQRTHGAIVPENIVPPSFGGRPHRDSLALNKAALWVVEHVLCIIGHDFPSIEFCPFIPALAVMLSHHLRTPDDLLGAMVSILKKSITASSNSSSSKSGNANWAFFPMHRKDLKLMGRMFASLLSKHNSKLATHLESFDSTSSPNHQDPPWQSWFSDLFIDQLPQAMLWRMLDCFLLEGYVVLFRFGIALLQLHRNTLVSLKSPTECTNLFKMQNLKVPVNVFCDSASGVSITAADIEKAKAKKINAVSLEEIHEMQYKYQRGRPKLKDESTIVQELHWIALWSWIPPRFRLSDVELIFTTGEHGYNLNTMYEMTSARKPLILVLETMEGGIFGAFISTGWPEVGENPGFQGDGETFMFTLEPYAKMYSWVGLASADGGEGAVEVKAENSMFVR